ncbi:MAG: N-acetylmuramoyl-L-alanine amidase [Verrucomicrobia bacterium]|nr:MAG: N-acetylmuramoyl-L-alanine amidase [Verrucomicrobiota bacterium]
MRCVKNRSHTGPPLLPSFASVKRFWRFCLSGAVLTGISPSPLAHARGSVPPELGVFEHRKGDEIVVCGQFVHTGTRVILWMDPGGYDAYRVERRFVPLDKSDWGTSWRENDLLTQPNRYNMRKRSVMTDEDIERVRGGGWDLPLLQKVVDQFVIHFDVCGTSRQCFNILQDHRDLSVHFMLDLDGTLYQTLDLKERAWHATIANSRSVGIEIANMGAYHPKRAETLDEWYAKDSHGGVRITIPSAYGDGAIHTKGFVGHPARPELVRGTIQGQDLVQYDYTPEQYRALIKLTATLCKVFPKIKCDYPKDGSGKLIPQKLADDDLDKYQGVLGHYHVQTDKTDPGPAFQWDYVIGNAQKLLQSPKSKIQSPKAEGE